MKFLFFKKKKLSKKYSIPFSSVLRNAITMQTTRKKFSIFKKGSYSIINTTPAI